jgi:uncharacterized protein (DUF934 family)
MTLRRWVTNQQWLVRERQESQQMASAGRATVRCRVHRADAWEMVPSREEEVTVGFLPMADTGVLLSLLAGALLIALRGSEEGW